MSTKLLRVRAGHTPGCTMPDWTRLLDILKATGWQLLAIASAGAALLYLNASGVIPPFDPWAVQLTAVISMVSGCLALASAAPVVIRIADQPLTALQRKLRIRQAKRQFREYIPHLGEVERKIFAYLLAKNRKVFVADIDGGYAGPLISLGYIRCVARPNQLFDTDKCPFAVPDYVWDVLVECRDQFKYTPRSDVDQEVEPWRIPWMAR